MSALVATVTSATASINTKKNNNCNAAKLRFYRQAYLAEKEKPIYKHTKGKEPYNRYPNEQARNMALKDYQK